MIKLTKHSESQYSVNLQNGEFIGYFERGDDGWFHWRPELKETGGYWNVALISELAEKLNKVNEPYEKELDVYFESVSKITENHLEKQE